MARLTGTRRPSVVVAVALAATVAAAGLWWLHGRPTILTDWREVARCTPDLDRLGPRAAAAPAPTACTGAISPTVEPAVPGRVVLSVLLLAGPEDRPRVGSVSIDRDARRVSVAAAPLPSPGGGGHLGMAVATLVFVSVPAAELPATPFTLVDDAGPAQVSAIAP